MLSDYPNKILAGEVKLQPATTKPDPTVGSGMEELAYITLLGIPEGRCSNCLVELYRPDNTSAAKQQVCCWNCGAPNLISKLWEQ